MAIARSPEGPAGRKAGFGRRGLGANLVCGSYPFCGSYPSRSGRSFRLASPVGMGLAG